MKPVLPILLLGLMAWPAAAGIDVDGTRAGEGNAYGAPASVQTIETGFGDNLSEWNAAYCAIIGNRLHLLFTGNVEGNFNKVEIFIDSVDGGSNVFPANPGNDGAGVMAGMTFDAAFTPEYHLISRRGFDGSTNKFDVDIAELGTANFDAYFSIFGDAQEGSGATGTGTVNASPIEVGYNNSNVAGIGGNTGVAADQDAAKAVKTGLELSIDLADIGSPSGPFKVMLLQNNDNHDFLSNQTLGGLPVGTGNLGSPAASVDFSSLAGDQFFVISHDAIPEPATLVLACIAAATVLGLRRRWA